LSHVKKLELKSIAVLPSQLQSLHEYGKKLDELNSWFNQED